jgi:glycosyltransferase involved in cell wall biosynthesis
VSPRVAREAVETRLAGPARVGVAPSAVELDQIPSRPDPVVRAELGIPASVPVVGTVGRIDQQKSPLDFVRMAAAVARRHPDARFVMVGAGPLEDAVRAEAARLGVEVLLTGYRSDAPRIGASFDVFVISSLYEGLGRALTEALASGRPVVATAVNGVPDLVVPGATGLLAPPRDPDALAESVGWLLDHPEEGRRMGARGRAGVLAVFAPERMCNLIDQAYCRLLGLPAPAPTVDLTRAAAPASTADLDLTDPEPAVELSA